MKSLFDHLDKLRDFVTIADVGSLQGAAVQLHVSQPALSLKVRTLEDAAGFQLFTRSKKGVELTPAGHNLYRFSKRLISETELLALEMKGDHARVRIGTFDIIAHMIAPALCRAAQLTDVNFRTERAGLLLLDALDKDEIDIAVVDDPPIIPGFNYQQLARSPYGLFSTKEFQKGLPRKGEALLEALKNAPLIYVPGGLAYEQVDAKRLAPKMLIDSFIQKLGLGAGNRIRLDSHALSLKLTLQGHGLGLMLVGHVLQDLRCGALVEHRHERLPMPFSSMLFMVTKTSRDQSQLADALRTIDGVFKDAVATYRAARS